MKQIEQHEIYEHLSEFLKNKGIEFTDGSYARTVQKGCSILTDTINLSQRGLERARVTLDKKLDAVRQTIHEKTAPKASSTATKAEAAPSKPPVSPPTRPTAAKRRKAARKTPRPAKKKA